jgi:IS4 transposase
LLLDRGFYGVDVVRYLQAARYPFLMPVVHRGRKSKRKLTELKGTRRFLARKKSGWSTHQMCAKNKTASVQICIACDNYAGRWNQHRRRTLVYAYWGFQPPSPQWVRETYRTRFGIETSYRQMNQARIRTCSRKPILRFFFAGIALILRNTWVWIHLTILSLRHANGRIILRLERMRFRTLLLRLQRCAEAMFGCSEAVEMQNQP